ncbi:MAG: MBG domain-containing protein, partial [Arcobacteraceae bacterium]
GILLSHSEFSGTITIGTNGSFVGGLVGYNHSFIESSTNSGTITVGNGSDYVGGITGANYDQWNANTPTIQDNNSFTGTITAGTNSTKIGGISGYNSSNGVITAFDSSGTLTVGSGSTYVGGIVGQDANNANGISDGFSTTSVSVGGVSATVDKGVTSPYIGRLVGNGGTQDGTISYKTLLTFTLSDIISGYIYNGQSQLPTEWTASSIFGSSYASWDLGTDYKLIYNNTDTTGFTNAGTYSGISVEVLNTGFVKSSIGNTTGSFTIDKAPLSVTALDDTKTYDGVAYSGGNGVSYNGFVNGEGVSELGGTLAYGGTSQGAVNSGDYTIVPSGLTASNYELSYIGGALSIVAPTPTPTPTPDATLPSESSIDTDATIISTPDIESNTQDPTPDIPVSDEALEVVEIKKIEQVIASIVNIQQIKVEVPKIHIPKVEAPKQNIKLPTNLAVKVGVNDGEKVSVVSSPLQSQQIQKVTMSELVDTNQEESSDNKTDAPIIKDIKVAIGENSIVQLINGGVSLPQGLEQEFYIVKSNQRGTN